MGFARTQGISCCLRSFSPLGENCTPRGYSYPNDSKDRRVSYVGQTRGWKVWDKEQAGSDGQTRREQTRP
jgi:hypothetical protein